MSSLLARVNRYIENEVDPRDRAELVALLERARGDDASALQDLEERFAGALGFGTAGIRAIVGAGESRMNRATVRRVTEGLARHLVASVSDARSRGVVVARDGRTLSQEFQRDAASVCAAHGLPVHVLSGPQPTPLLAFAVSHLKAACGIMITASHNPPAYNGYKVYWENGAQVVPPVDESIARAIERAPGARLVPLAPESTLVREAGDVREAYLHAVSELALAPGIEVPKLRIAYSALHGTGQEIFTEVSRRRGFDAIFPVPEQATPDPDFPTVSFPNPEEPGALDLVLQVARDNDCDLALVHDPDADRLGAAVRRRRGEYVVLSGNEIGCLLGFHVLSLTRESSPLVVSTIVSSRMLSRIAADFGARYEDTLTGFKWIANEAMRIEDEEGYRFVFGYEEALGFTVGTIVRDKDGIGAGLALAEMAAGLKEKKATLLDALAFLRRRYGYFASRQRSLTLRGADGAKRIEEAMERLRREPPLHVVSELASGIWDLEKGTYTYPDGSRENRERLRGDVLVFDLEDGGRVAVRPSGTEPKLKFYFEVAGWIDAPAHTESRLRDLEEDFLEASGLAEEV